MSKNGWGLRTELIIILVFLICLIISTIGLNKMGLIGGRLDDINVGKTDANTSDTYLMLEQKLTSAAKNYVNNYYGGEYISETLTVRYSSLYYNGYLQKLSDNNNKECSGYVIVEKIDSNLIYDPYLKCSGYKTKGYDSSKDW